MSPPLDLEAKVPDLLNRDQILSGLGTRWLGRDLRFFTEVGSTNEVARSLAEQGENGTVVLAETQTRGQGRLSRSWSSPPGGIWMSLVLRPDIPIALAYQINMAVCVAACRAISTLLDLETGIKWPNDLLVGERKVGGILMEVGAVGDGLDYALDYAIVGLGINANIDPSSFPDEWMATSLSREMGSGVSRTALIQRTLLEMEWAYENIGSEAIYNEWRRRSSTIGRTVCIRARFGELVGEVVDLARDGALLLRRDDEVVRVLAGDCIHLRGMVGL